MLSNPMQDTPQFHAIPPRDNIAEGVSHPSCLVLMWYRTSVVEIPLLHRGIVPQERMFFSLEEPNVYQNKLVPICQFFNRERAEYCFESTVSEERTH